MIKLRAYTPNDAKTVLSWCKNEKSFYQWTAGVLGKYPLSEEEFNKVDSFIAFIAYDESGAVGFFTLRDPGKGTNELRFGFVIVDDGKRGMGYGKRMLALGLDHAFDVCRADKVTIGVFENNPSAYNCYSSLGFLPSETDPVTHYSILGEDWQCLELEMIKQQSHAVSP